MRRPMAPPPPTSGPRYNEFIQSPKVRVIDENGENLGVMFTREAMEQAAEAGLDLVEVSPNAAPPVAIPAPVLRWMKKEWVDLLQTSVIRIQPAGKEPDAKAVPPSPAPGASK